MSQNQYYYRTTPARTGKMMAIMLGICIVGGAIFFGIWDYWISEPAPVVAMMAGDSGPTEVAVHTGATITSDLSFIESSDFITLAFNALPGEPDNNPTINMEVGDKVIFNVVNDGKSFHSFGVTKTLRALVELFQEEVASPANPLKPGESGSSEFIAGEEGVFYYICTVPGHREQGMVGKIIVGDVGFQKKLWKQHQNQWQKQNQWKNQNQCFNKNQLHMMEQSQYPSSRRLWSSWMSTKQMNAISHIMLQSAAGTEIVWSNDDTAAHTVTSGTPQMVLMEYLIVAYLLEV